MSEQDTDQVVDSAETTTEELSDNSESYEDTGTSEAAEADEESNSESSQSETPDQRLARLKRQYERELKKQGLKSKEGGEESSQKGSQENDPSQEVDEKYLRLDLKTEGVKTKKEQDIVLDYIREKKLLGEDVEPSQALKSMVVKEALAAVKQKSSVPKPSSRTSTQNTNDFDYWVKQAKKGNFPTSDPAMMDRLAKARIFTK